MRSTLDKKLQELADKALKQQEPHEMDEFTYTEGFIEGFRLAMVSVNNAAAWTASAAQVLAERDEIDPTPWCSGCGSKTQKGCHCGPRAEND